MKLAIITPVGPGHKEISQRARDSVCALESGPFDIITHVVINDLEGKLERSQARNLGMIEADWYFFLDADDIIEPDATLYLQQDYSATFGRRKFIDWDRENYYPCDWNVIKKYGSEGTLSMGFFVKAEVAKELKFNENMIIGEDFDFYMRLPDFIKVPQSLVTIGSDVPGCTGGHELDWTGACQKVIDSYFEQRVY